MGGGGGGWGGVGLGGRINGRERVGGAAQVVAHFLKARSVEETGDRDKADDARVVLWIVVEHFPGRPPPKEDVEIAEVFGVRADAPFAWRQPGVKRSGRSSCRIARF